MIFNVTGGGGAALNFKVVAYASEDALPATAAENTIAVITDTAITSYIFSAEEPSPATAGMVWIQVGDSSTVAFAATKKNPVMVYPLNVKQYADGAWVSKTAKSYQGGKWVDWITYLYNQGDECIDDSGGWAISTGNPTSATHGESITKESEYIQFTSKFVKNVNYAYGFLRASTPVDLNNKSQITLVCPYASINSLVPIALVACETDTIMAYGSAAAKAEISSVSAKTEFTLDVNALSGTYYVGIAAAGGSPDGGTSVVRMSEMKYS